MPDREPFAFEFLAPYYRGAYFASVAIKGRLAALGYVDAAREVTAYQEMVQEFREAIVETDRLRRERQQTAPDRDGLARTRSTP